MPITKTCSLSGEEFTLSDQELEFLEKVGAPIPDISPDERRRQRMSWATFRTLHRRKCDATGKDILSMYAPDAKHPVYHSDFWWSDNWDPLEFGREMDFSRPFFEQFNELLCEVPVMHQSVINSQNCEYINMAGDCKNCYLSFFLDFCEDCYYIQDCNGNRNCVDCLGVTKSELCYECVDCTGGYNLRFSSRSVNCSDSSFLTDCRGCDHCIGCFNLANKSYYVFNEKVSPERFEALSKELESRRKVAEIEQYVRTVSPKYPKKFFIGHSNENFSGDNLKNTRNSFDCFNCHDLENVIHGDYYFGANNCVDVTIYGLNSEWNYNCLKTGDQASNNLCCLMCWTGSFDNSYCHLVIGTKDCFGCSSLRQKQYCILNKQYSKEDYQALKEKIIAHMRETGEYGKFFPMEISPFAYNESIAQDYYPLSKEETLAKGLRWRDEDISAMGDKASVPADARVAAEIPDHVSNISNSLHGNPFICEESGKPFRFTKAELEFYQKNKIPAPKLCPDTRHFRRNALRNPSKLWSSSCAKCSQEFETSFSPERPEEVFCERCYLDAVV